MGKKDKSKHMSRSRSRSRSRDRKKHKKKDNKKRRNSSESLSDQEQSGSRSRPQLTAKQIELLQDQRRKQKEMVKALETPEEKRLRRLGKKEAKERKRKEKMGWDEEYMGYTNMDNPFGDEHLLDTFVWKEKMEKEGKSQFSIAEIEKWQKNKMIENKMELEKVKKRRLERDREREEQDNEREMLQREKEAEYYNAWEKQEDKFHLHQAKLRSKIRIEDGRAKPIDLLARYISAEEEDNLAVEMHEPYTYLNGLTIGDLEDLLEDIKVYMELEQGQNTAYWRDLITITEDELSKLRKIDPNGCIGQRRSGINQSVADDVAEIFRGKTLVQLQLLESNIESKLKGGHGSGVDVGYWESLQHQLHAHIARTRLRDKHQQLLRRKLFKLKQEQGITESTPLFPIVKSEPAATQEQATSSTTLSEEQTFKVPNPPASAAVGETTEEVEPGPSTSGTQAAESVEVDQIKEEEEKGEEKEKDEEQSKQQSLDQYYADYEAAGYSPQLNRLAEPDAIICDESEDLTRLEYARRSVLKTGCARRDNDAELMKRARDGMMGDESQFSVEVPVETHAVVWSDKYRPRKPRFFNRVHTGFEWNKYNQTHYDIDNPPPKIVQGYKFNIFYPDLIDKSKPPTYTLTPIPDEQDFSVLCFSAGPPYEDIGFKIVNREWEYSYKKGFRCQFQNKIFQLWFHFKRYRYRR